MPAKKTSAKKSAAKKSSAPTTPVTGELNPTAKGTGYEENDKRMQPGRCETDETTGQRVIHPLANPQQVNPIDSAEHEAAATSEAEILADKESTHAEKMEATAVSNLAQGAPAAETNPHLPENKS